eukprot:CAMPEP_0118684116 /NCGR_PEP_ID=MMETSP0800-20121206/6458_1 /TAXON_ID=210618 ORGANISM="Striatella unipunctata, Strain CCMP2910" /NCGR_SAMPLE_ID=MMETSP0800 /ASSEMBLY_ACC=CAM_ASM_000638 /LENGTH=343 /DNA_ID=CAMNT_0006580773 /DNA_START=52 /DNA_END=1086 /DNA_ORIENTATION=+
MKTQAFKRILLTFAFYGILVSARTSGGRSSSSSSSSKSSSSKSSTTKKSTPSYMKPTIPYTPTYKAPTPYYYVEPTAYNNYYPSPTPGTRSNFRPTPRPTMRPNGALYKKKITITGWYSECNYNNVVSSTQSACSGSYQRLNTPIVTDYRANTCFMHPLKPRNEQIEINWTGPRSSNKQDLFLYTIVLDSETYLSTVSEYCDTSGTGRCTSCQFIETERKGWNSTATTTTTTTTGQARLSANYSTIYSSAIHYSKQDQEMCGIQKEIKYIGGGVLQKNNSKDVSSVSSCILQASVISESPVTTTQSSSSSSSSSSSAFGMHGSSFTMLVVGTLLVACTTFLFV